MMRLLDIGNRSHRPPAYVEWWYFHFAGTDGTTLNMVLHETGIFGLDTSPYLSLSIHRPGQPPRYLKRPLSLGAIATDSPYLRVGQLLQETPHHLFLDIPFGDGNQLSGTVTKLAAPLVVNGGLLYQEPFSGRCSYWVVGIPHATFQGTLQLDGASYELQGFAYQDHQWGNILFQEWVSDWVWGHFSQGETAVFFFQILTRQGERIERVGWLTPLESFSSGRVATGYLSQLRQQPQPEQTALQLTITIGSEQLAFAIRPEGLMRSRLAEAVGEQCASYLRWATTATFSACGEQPLYGITEYIRIRHGVLNPQSTRNPAHAAVTV